MIESNNPEINVDELMNKIRDEVARRRSSEGGLQPNCSPVSSTASPFNWPQVMASLSMADQNADAGGTILPMMRFRKVIRWLARFTGRVVIYLAQVVTVPQRRFNQAILQAVRISVDGVRDVLQGLTERDNRIVGLEESVKQGLTERDNRMIGLEESVKQGLTERDNRMIGLEESLNQGLTEHDNWIVGLEESVNQGFAERDSRIAEMEGSLTERDNRIVGLEESLNRGLAERDNRIVGLEESLNRGLAERDNRIARLEKSISHLKTSLVLQERRLGILLEEARKRLPEPFNQGQLQNFANAEIQLLDPLYVFFEDQFRGTREDIKDRFKVYLPLIQKAKAGTDKRPILDVGCGRGEWLELLNEEGFQIRGLDINSVLVEQCRERGMDVVEGDAVEYLRTLTDASLGAVTGFHLIEHMPFEALMDLLDETVRVLKPGGLAIFETPNPENILVGTYSFYFDPTHRNPLPAPLIKFLAESRGLCRVEIKLLNPYDQAFRISDDSSDLAKRFNDYFYGPRDYAVLGYKI